MIFEQRRRALRLVHLGKLQIGLLLGTLDAALDVTPVLGGVKMIAEKMRGRDFIPDKASVASAAR